MRVKELIELLKQRDPNLRVRVSQEECSSGDIGGTSIGRSGGGRHSDETLILSEEVVLINASLEDEQSLTYEDKR